LIVLFFDKVVSRRFSYALLNTTVLLCGQGESDTPTGEAAGTLQVIYHMSFKYNPISTYRVLMSHSYDNIRWQSISF